MVAPLVPQLVFTVGRRLIATHLVKNIVMMPAVAPVLSATTAVPASVAVGTVAAPLSLSGGVPIAMLLGAITTIVPLLKRVTHNTTARHRGIPKQQAAEEEIAAPVATASLADNADHLYLTIAAMLLILGLTFATERLMKGQRSLEILDDREIEEKGKIISASDAKLSSEREKKREEDDGEDEPTTISTLTDEDEHVSADNISVSAPTVQQSSTKRRISAWQRVVEPKKKMPQVIPARKKMERPPSPSPPAALPPTPVQGSHPYDVKQIDRIRRLDERKAMERRSRSEANAATKSQCAVRRTSAEKDVLRRLLVHLEEERALLKDQEVAEEERDRRQKGKAAKFLGDAPSTPPESIITPRSAPPSMSMFRKKPGIGNSYTTATGAVVDFQSGAYAAIPCSA